MPGMDGFELCARVKRIADLPIIVLSAVDASEAKVRALEDYAEDYITKPFEPDELVARVQRVLRRSATGHSQVVLDGGDLQIDLTGRRVTRPGGSFPLTPTEVRLLHVMIAQMDRTVPTDTHPQPRVVRIRRSRSLVRLGHHPPIAAQGRGRPGSAAIPGHRARGGLPARLLHRGRSRRGGVARWGSAAHPCACWRCC